MSINSAWVNSVEDYDENDSGERVYKAVFTDLEQPGDYYITVRADNIDASPRFTIGNEVCESLLADAARYLYYQRAGIDLTSPYFMDYPRQDKTPQDSAAIFESDPAITRDVTKEWYDASDLGKYVSTGAMTLVNLLWSYELFPEVYADGQLNIPESGNSIPDILDESRWEIEWILKIQDAASGGFYTQVQSDDDGDITERIIKDTVDSNTNVKPTEPTACASAALAQASIVYADYDPAFALVCLNAAEIAWVYLEQNPENIKAMGPYGTDDDSPGRFLAAASLYRVTGEAKYNDYFMAHYSNGKDAFENPTGDWVGMWNFAFFSYMKADNRNSDVVNWYGDDCIKTIFGTFNEDGKTGIPRGFMPGGSNRYQGEGLSLFPAKCYLDSADEWATNEYTTGWNTILVFIIAFANSSPVSSVILGDTNNDGMIDIVDSLLTAQYYVGLNPPGFIAAKADVDYNGTIDIVDALLIAKYYIGLISHFC
jgi:hypothetical protein